MGFCHRQTVICAILAGGTLWGNSLLSGCADSSLRHGGVPTLSPSAIASLPPHSAASAISQESPIPVTVGQRTYHIGNSLTDTINDQLEPIAKSAGYTHTFLRSTIPGAPTDWNWDHPGEASGERDYRVVFNTRAPLDHLFIQPYAGHDRSIENEAEYSGRFYRLARQKSPNVQLWIYAQWANRSFHDNWAKATGSAARLGLTPAKTWEAAINNHLRYHEAVRQRLDDQNDGKPVLIVPAGLALLRLKRAIDAGQVPGITDFFTSQFQDEIGHLSKQGAYLVALVHYACIYRRSPVGVSAANSGLTPSQASMYQQIAWDTVQNYPWSGLAGTTSRLIPSPSVAEFPSTFYKILAVVE